jgi:Tfp pilus assembly PilM family ATPase
VRARAEEIFARLRAGAQRLSQHYLGPAQAVGLDIGAESAKAVHIIDLGEQVEVCLFGATPLRGEGGQAAPGAAQRVRDLLDGWGFPTRRLVANLSGRECLVRRLRLPFADLAKAARVAPFELEHDLPVAASEMVLELFPLSGNGAGGGPEEAAGGGEGGGAESGGGGLSALALATTRERLRARLALFSEAGLDPSAVEADPLALYQAFGALHPEAAEALVLDLGASKSTLLVVRSGKLLAVRTISWGGDALTLSLATHWGVSFGQAERVKRERCSLVAPQEAEKVSGRRLEASEVLRAGLEPLLREIRRTLLACGEEAAGSGNGAGAELPPCPRLYLCGGGSLLTGLAAHLGRELNCPVQPLAASPRLSLAAGAGEAEAALLPTALGLALRRTRKQSRVDFRRSDLLPASETRGMKAGAVWVGAVLLLSAALGLTDLHVRGTSSEERLTAIKARAEELYRGAVPGKGVVPDPLRLLERKLKEAEAEPLPDGGRPYEVLEIMRAVTGATGGGSLKVKVRRLAVEDLSAQVEGEAADKDTVTRLRMALLKTSLFKECEVKGATPLKGGAVGFTLVLKRG